MTFQNYSMANLAFDRFGIGTFSGELFLSTLFRWLISLPGLLFNAALLNTIARDKNLDGTCSILLAIGSAVDFCYLLTFSIPLAISLVGQNLISNFCCYFLQCLPNFGLFSSVWIVFFVGFDRLISVLVPLRYNLLEEHFLLYLSPMLAVTFGYSIYVLATAAQWTLFVYPDWPVLCGNGDMFSFGMSTILLRNGLVINGVAFICYALVGLVLFRCWQKNPSAVAKHRIFKSLAAIMTLVVGSYLAVCVFRLLLGAVTNPLFVLHISPSVTALFTVISASSNAPLLFAFSCEYRLAFHKHLRRWPLVGKWLIKMEQQTQIAVTVNFNAANPSNVVSRIGPITTIRSSNNSRMTSIE
uniref:G-protein coupled receptors family 1 profile domain-containing protein n=1 Tax=Globodera rostochiensis TaxID=31243 RepID=A0A914I1E3_GLORO